jgi:hypothetical protein
MWDKKPFWNNLLNLIIYNIYSIYPHRLFLNFFIKNIKTSNIFLKNSKSKALAGSVSFKIQAWNWLGVNRSTRRVHLKLEWPSRDPFFFKCFFFLIPKDLSFLIFFSWLLSHFKIHYINIRIIFYFFNVGFEAL